MYAQANKSFIADSSTKESSIYFSTKPFILDMCRYISECKNDRMDSKGQNKN